MCVTQFFYVNLCLNFRIAKISYLLIWIGNNTYLKVKTWQLLEAQKVFILFKSVL